MSNGFVLCLMCCGVMLHLLTIYLYIFSHGGGVVVSTPSRA